LDIALVKEHGKSGQVYVPTSIAGSLWKQFFESFCKTKGVGRPLQAESTRNGSADLACARIVQQRNCPIVQGWSISQMDALMPRNFKA
jgi:hypothetical protein